MHGNTEDKGTFEVYRMRETHLSLEYKWSISYFTIPPRGLYIVLFILPYRPRSGGGRQTLLCLEGSPWEA